MSVAMALSGSTAELPLDSSVVREPSSQAALPSAARPAIEVPDLAAMRRYSSRQLLGRDKEVLIEHQGSVYRLRQTALGKLILTK
ncbi:hemin uptake protein HemP [Pseudaquabacterium rugosum]|uniref:Hemin uptake protein HemP n=1 Tax=Pseudaquabacterium rugosum TaxID=2984194 RepID=A0ABU9B6X3_9BURK